MITLTSDEWKQLKEYTSRTSADRIDLLMTTAHSLFPRSHTGAKAAGLQARLSGDDGLLE